MYGFYFGVTDENVLKLVVMIAQHCESTKSH